MRFLVCSQKLKSPLFLFGVFKEASVFLFLWMFWKKQKDSFEACVFRGLILRISFVRGFASLFSCSTTTEFKPGSLEQNSLQKAASVFNDLSWWWYRSPKMNASSHGNRFCISVASRVAS